MGSSLTGHDLAEGVWDRLLEIVATHVSARG
jgi:hypothetical protein